MGWWSCGNKDSKLVIGDGPADIMGPAIDKIIKEYEREWDRKPTMFELFELVKFITGPLELNKK